MERTTTAWSFERRRVRVFGLLLVLVLFGGATAVAVSMLRTVVRGPVPASTAVEDSVVDGPGPFTVGQTIRTSFGYVAVEHVEAIAGLSAKDVAGASHGVQNLVPEDKAQLQVTVQLTSGQAAAVAPYTAEQFQVRVDSAAAAAIAPSSSTIANGALQPYASVDGHLGFVVPRDAVSATLEFLDPGRPTAIVISLGPLLLPPPTGSPTGPDHHH